MEPLACGEGPLKTIVKHGKREESRENLLQILEAMTGIQPGEYLFEDRGEESYSAFEEELKKENQRRGRPCRDLILPAKPQFFKSDFDPEAALAVFC